VNVSTEDLIRAATRAQADLMREVRPLRLDGRSRPRAARHWRNWGAPAAAAALVIVLAAALAIIKAVSDGGRVHPVGPTHLVSGVPRYYVQLTPLGGTQTSGNGLRVGDTFTGGTVTTVAPPTGVTFLSVSAAADDRTFSVFATPSGGGSGAAGSWYSLTLAPGTSSPARLSRIPVSPLSGVAASALSGSGQELAVARSVGKTGTPWLGVYSVATGRLLRSWTAHGTPPFHVGGLDSGFPPSVTWLHGGGAIMFLTFKEVAEPGGSQVLTETLRLLDIATGDADLVKDSRVIWNGDGGDPCNTPPTSEDGQTIRCVQVLPAYGPKKINWDVRWVAFRVGAPGFYHVRSEVSVSAPPSPLMGLGVDTLWDSADGATMLVDWFYGPHGPSQPHKYRFGVVSHGTFTPLETPPLSAGSVSLPPGIAW
jgi:hypothetical protein